MSSTSISISSALRETEQLFSDAHIPTPRLDAEVLLAHTLGVTRPYLHAHGKDELESWKVRELESLVQRRLRREPVAYMTGTKEFYGREFIVTPDVLMPRPETEELVELVLEELEGRRKKEEGRQLQKAYKRVAQKGAAPTETKSIDFGEGGANSATGPAYSDLRGPVPREARADDGSGEIYKMLDVGCGSGCIGITLKLERPELDVTLCDISSKALEIGKKNAEKLGANVTFVESDLLSSFILHPSSFSVIIANLPYVDKTWETSPETKYEPSLALFAEDGGLELIKQLIEQSTEVLDEHGVLLLEADPEQHQRIIDIGIANGFTWRRTKGYALILERQASQ